MFDSLLLTGLTALGAGALATRVGRRFLLGDLKRDWLSEELELDSIDNDGLTVRLKSGAVFRVWHLRGANYDAMTIEQQENLLSSRANGLNQLGKTNVSIRFFGVKREGDIGFESDWPGPTLQEIGEAERDSFNASYRIDWYAVVCGDPPALAEAAMRFEAVFGSLRPKTIRQAREAGVPCDLSVFINYLICGDLHSDLPSISRNLSVALPASDLAIDKSTGLISANLPVRFGHKIIGIREFPGYMTGTLIADLISLPGELEIVQTCIPIAQEIAMPLLARKKRELSAPFLGNPILASEYEEVLDLVSTGNHHLWQTQWSVVARAKDTESLDRLVTAITRVLGRHWLAYSIETIGAPTVWFNRIPGNDRLLRPLKLLDGPISALWPCPYSANGREASPYGDRPVRLFRTPSGQAYGFQFHVSEKPQSLGNYLVFAPTGSGKSTLILHLLSGLAKFNNVRSYVFDSNKGAQYMIEALGGLYRSYENLALNPLDIGEDSQTNRHRIYTVLRAMAGRVNEEEEEEADFQHALNLAFSVVPGERLLDGIYPLAFRKRSALKQAMSKWVTDERGTKGLYAHVFNAPRDSLSGFLDQAHLVGINMNEALGDPVLGPPVVAHIAASIKAAAERMAAEQGGFNIFIDEGANLLQNEGFKAVVMEMFREYRKLNGAVGLAFQDPAALHRSGIAEAVIENTATFIFFPNSQASRSSLEAFNLNEEQISFILTGGGDSGARRVLVVQRHAASGIDESAILDVDLAILGDAVRFYRAGSSANAELEAHKEKWGSEWLEKL